MPWSAANFLREYSWQADRDLGIRIRADRMDAEFDNFKNGMEQLLLRDGSNSPTANIDWGGFTITNYGSGAGVVATKQDVAASEWQAETSVTVTWIDATSFSIAGVDLTSRYHTGRRVKIVHNTGATTSYGTVVSSAFSTNTTVIVALDEGAPLVSTITQLNYGLLSFVNQSYIGPKTMLRVTLASSQSYLGPDAFVDIEFDTKGFDVNDEYDVSTNVFTTKFPGYYNIVLRALFTQSGTGQPYPLAEILINDSPRAHTPNVVSAGTNGAACLSVVSTLALLETGDTVRAYVSFQLAGLIAGGQVDRSSLEIFRVA